VSTMATGAEQLGGGKVREGEKNILRLAEEKKGAQKGDSEKRKGKNRRPLSLFMWLAAQRVF